MEKPGNHGSGSERPARPSGTTSHPRSGGSNNSRSSTITNTSTISRDGGGGYEKSVRNTTTTTATSRGSSHGDTRLHDGGAIVAALDSKHRAAPLVPERHLGGKVTNVFPAGAGSLQDAVLAATKLQGRPSQSASAEIRHSEPSSSAGRDRNRPTKSAIPRSQSEGPSVPRSQSEGPPGRRTPKTSQTFGDQTVPKVPRARTSSGSISGESKPVSKSSNNNIGTARGKHPKAPDNAQNASSKTANTHMKKSRSSEVRAQNHTKDGGQALNSTVKDFNTQGQKTPPKLQRKLSRGHTVHDISEYSPRQEASRTDPDKEKQTALQGNSQSQHYRTMDDVSVKTSTQKPTPTKSVLLDISNRYPLSSTPRFPTSVSSPRLSSASSSARSSLKPQAGTLLPSQVAMPEGGQQSFFSFSSVPSLSSSSSSDDVQSEVCVDLPDYAELPSIQDDHATERDLEHQDLQVKVDFPTAPYQPLRRVGSRRHSAPCRYALETSLVLLASLLLFVPMLVLVLVLVPVCLFVKWLCSLCCCCGSLWGRCCVGCCHTHLSASERLWVRDGSKGGGVGRLAPVAQSVVVVQRGLSMERLRHLLDSRLLSLENRHGRRVYPRFTQRVVRFGCGYAWVTDEAFFINNHVVGMPGYIESLEDLQVCI